VTGVWFDAATITRALALVDEGTSFKAVGREIGAADTTVHVWHHKRLADPSLSWMPTDQAIPGARHGTTEGYYTDRCRCRPCRDAVAARQRTYDRARMLGHGGRTVPGVGTARRIRALYALGWTSDHIAEVAGMTGNAVRVTTRNARVTRDKERRIKRAYDELSMRLGPSRHLASQARARGYMPPLAWDDDTIDDPGAHPNLGTKVSGYGTRKLPDGERLAAEVNGASVAAVADRYQVGRRSIGKALRRAGYRAVMDGNQATYVREEAA
jgi:hypothetical protein